MYNRDVEIREAINAGERALSSLEEAKRSLGSACPLHLYDFNKLRKKKKACSNTRR